MTRLARILCVKRPALATPLVCSHNSSSLKVNLCTHHPPGRLMSLSIVWQTIVLPVVRRRVDCPRRSLFVDGGEACESNQTRGGIVSLFSPALINIGKRLGAQQSKEEKTSRLMAELRTLNLNLPARVWLPIHSHTPHLVVRIPPEFAVVLNSKDKAPYLLYVEVLEVDNVQSCPIPAKINPTAALRHTRSEENLIDHTTLNTSDSSGNQSHSNVSTPPVRGAYGVAAHVEPCTSLTLCVRSEPAAVIQPTAFHIYDDLSDAWSQEDDEITDQYLHLRLSLKVSCFTLCQHSPLVIHPLNWI